MARLTWTNTDWANNPWSDSDPSGAVGRGEGRLDLSDDVALTRRAFSGRAGAEPLVGELLVGQPLVGQPLVGQLVAEYSYS